MASKMTKGYVGWELPASERMRLLNEFPPSYVRVVAHHCTLKFGVTSDEPLPTATEGQIVGVADDGMGVQALVLRISGTSTRPGGGAYHITWSLGTGRKPVESNQVIASQGFVPVHPPVPVRLTPKFFPMGS
jgi:hypothetical protein